MGGPIHTGGGIVEFRCRYGENARRRSALQGHEECERIAGASALRRRDKIASTGAKNAASGQGT